MTLYIYKWRTCLPLEIHESQLATCSLDIVFPDGAQTGNEANDQLATGIRRLYVRPSYLTNSHSLLKAGLSVPRNA